jgi:MOSC domain-containing protein YiiM
MARIVSIVYSPKTDNPRPADHYHRVTIPETNLIAGKGIEGDRKGKFEGRQLNIMSAESLKALQNDGFRTGPGELGEQIVVEGLDVNVLPAGTRIQLGTTGVVEVTEPRSGCDRFEHIQGKSKGLVRGRFGVLARVVAGGPIAVGDVVKIVS